MKWFHRSWVTHYVSPVTCVPCFWTSQIKSWGPDPKVLGPENPGCCHSAFQGHSCWSKWPTWGLHNHRNFCLWCQQPQGLPQAMTETLLAVAVRPSDGRVGTVSLPLPTHSPTAPLLCPRSHAGIGLCSCPRAVLCYPHPQHFCYPLIPAASLVLPLLPRQFPFFFTFLPFPDSDPPESFPRSQQPKGTRDVPSNGCPQAVAWGSMRRAARVKISLSSVAIWLLVWCEVVSACLIGCRACSRTAWFVLQDFGVWGGGQAWVHVQAWLAWLLE